VTTGFFETLDIPLVAGRRFDRRDTANSAPVVVLNDRAATQLFGDARQAVGRRLKVGDDTWREVVGVVGNVRTTFFNTLEWRTAAIVYRPAMQTLSAVADPEATQMTLWVHIRVDRALPIAEIRDAASVASPQAMVLSLQPVSDMVVAATRQPTLRMTLLLGFCGASLLLAAIGIYGIVAQAVVERRREIAIRMALGALPRALTISLIRKALMTGIAGLTIGLALSMMLARWLESMLYGVRMGDAASLTAAGLLLLAVTAIAAWLPAIRATRTTSVHILRA
jgi:putative ABC transport system permease protein